MPRLGALWEHLRDSLWFLPAIIVLSAILLGVAMIELSAVVDEKTLARWPRVFGAGPEGSRSMLAAIAGSMITVAGVTFSITMVAVTQASTQYTPRILRSFMRDRANQAVLGTFVGIFAYCLVVLRTIREGNEEDFVPSVAVLVGVLLALLGVAVLIFFVHHIATTLQASEIVARITHDTRHVVERLYVEPVGAPDTGPDSSLPPMPRAGWHPVPAPKTGYIQRADIPGLVRLADRYDLLVRLARPTGEFVVRDHPLAYFAADPEGEGRSAQGESQAQEAAAALGGKFVIGRTRSLDHDPGFGIRQLVDVALKALSPGINDSTTAVTCVDYLGALLMQLAGQARRMEHRGAANRLRVVSAEPTFEELLAVAVDEIRQHADGNVGVLARQLDMLGKVMAVTPAGPRRLAVARHVELVRRAGAATVTESHDQERLELAAHRVLEGGP